MQGTITHFNQETNTGHIQAENGQIFRFTLSDITDDIAPAQNMKVSFTESGEQALAIKIVNLDDFKLENTFYVEPEQIGICKDSVPEGYTLIDKASYRIEKEERLINRAKWKLLDECHKCGANVVLDFKQEQHIRNSIGFSFYYYKVSGVPAVMGKVCKDGDVTEADLKKSLNHERIKKLYERGEDTKLGMVIVKVLGAILLAVFIVGFFISL